MKRLFLLLIATLLLGQGQLETTGLSSEILINTTGLSDTLKFGSLMSNLIGHYPLRSGYGKSGTQQITGDDSDFDTVGNWTGSGASVAGGYDSGDAGHDKCLRIIGAGLNDRAQLATADLTDGDLTLGESYRVVMDYKWIVPTAGITRVQLGDSNDDSNMGKETVWTKYVSNVFVPITTNAPLRIYVTVTGGAGQELLIDNIRLVPLLSSDITPQGNHAEVLGADVQSEYTEFDATNTEYLSSDFDASGLSSLIVNVWMYKASGDLVSIGQYINSSNRFYFIWLTDDALYAILNDGDTNYVSKPITGFSEWKMATLVFDGSQGTPTDRVRLFVNAVELTSLDSGGTLPTAIPTLGASTEIGRYGSGTYSTGRMDALRFYTDKSALTDAELQTFITSLYDKGRN